MNARGLAEEVATWYEDQVDPWNPHCTNVRRHLQGPVLSLTHGILTGKDATTSDQQQYTKEDEKKCDAGPDKSLWSMTADSKAMDDLYTSLGRRHRARLDAFFTGVELAVPSEGERERSVSSSSSMESLPECKPATDTTKAKKKKTPAKKPPPIESSKSPVLTSLNNHGKALLRSVSDTKTKPPQIRHPELRIRLELYIRSLYRVRSLDQDCVLQVEPDRAIKARAELIVSAFVSTVGCVRSMSPTLTKLLVNLTKELLAVEYVGEELFRVIRRLVNEYEHGTSFASLAFLSSPDVSAENRLTPMILKYIRYLQSDWKNHEQACELERMLSCSLDGRMRRYLKTVEFQSIGHLLEVCQGFRTELQTIELNASNNDNGDRDLCNNPDAVRQAIRDLQREVITINGHVLPPVTSRSDLIRLLSQSLNSRTLTPSVISTEPSTDTEESLDDSPDIKRRPSRRASVFHLATIDLLTRRLLIAASRTGTGGDAYFIVRDLFGDEDVEVVPATVLPHHVRAARVGSIEIQVRLASVTIRCNGSFDIYPKSLVGTCEPLIQLHTSSSETIYLQELRPCDSSSEDGRQCFKDDGSLSSDGMEALVLQEKKTSKTGRRILSIRPALYEKVQEYSTPS